MSQMIPLFQFSHRNSSLPPYVALDQYIANALSSANCPPNMDQCVMRQSVHLSFPDSANGCNTAMQASQMALQQGQKGIWPGRSRFPSSQSDIAAVSLIEVEDTATSTLAFDVDLSSPLLPTDENEEDTQSIDEVVSDDDGNDGDNEYGSDSPNGQIRSTMQSRANHTGASRPSRAVRDRDRLEKHHPELLTMWADLEGLPAIKTIKAEQPKRILRMLKPFQLEGLSWMQAMEKTKWGGGLLGDEMGMGKTIQAVSLIMSDYPAKNPSLVLIPPVALMQWQQEIGEFTDGALKTFVFHTTNKITKDITPEALKRYDVILMSYNSLESMYRHQEKGLQRMNEVHFQKSIIHELHFHRVILDEAHNIKASKPTI